MKAEREIMLFIGKPKGRSKMISSIIIAYKASAGHQRHAGFNPLPKEFALCLRVLLRPYLDLSQGAHPLIHCCRVCALRCLERTYARALSSLCFSPPSSLSCSFPFRFYLFWSLPPLSVDCSLAVFVSLVRFLSFSTPGNHDFNLRQSNSHCECILSLSCPWHFVSDRTVEEKNRGRDKLMRKDRDLRTRGKISLHIIVRD